MTSYGRIEVAQRAGAEPFHLAGRPLGFDVLSFWRWAFSDLTGNALRGVVAEYLVAHALGVDADTVRAEWDAIDLRTKAGVAVEVKAAAYLQTWPQEEPSEIKFTIAPTKGWNAGTNKSASHIVRWADVYVFALLHHEEQSTLDPLDLTQWTFYVLPRAVHPRVCRRSARSHRTTARHSHATAMCPRTLDLRCRLVPILRLGKARCNSDRT